jgi:hypothetical protein
VADGSLSAVVETVYALDQFKEAFDQSLKSNRSGKILFKVWSYPWMIAKPVRSAFRGSEAVLGTAVECHSRTLQGCASPRVISTMAEMIGTLIRAQAVDDPTLSDEIRCATSLNPSEDASHHTVDRFRPG